MTTHTVTKGKGGTFEAEGLGRYTEKSWMSYDCDVTLADGLALQFSARGGVATTSRRRRPVASSVSTTRPRGRATRDR